MIERLLIANRGEIACRIIRTCRSMGIFSVAVYSDADADARHVHEADSAVRLGGLTSAESYLMMDKLIDAARRSGVDAVHPGFGFLAENAAFARAVIDAGLTWIGPSPDAIESMGSKSAAKALVERFAVPTVPGYQGADQSDARFISEAARIGYPVMVKAAAGGGGKGMRLVTQADALPDALSAARREAGQAFGSNELLLEKALVNPRHIEFQVLGDTFGHLIHLGERECSIQRRHQKIIEETPSPALTPELRARMGQAAVDAARSVGYTNAGTVEFLLAPDGQFYFLEMNTRLQVEHPVTELVYGLDLVAWQIRIAEGHALTIQQDDVTPRGHAVEVRVYAENPANDFLPATGDVLLWREPSGEGVRVDSGLKARDVVSMYYDPMLAKIIAHGADRESSRRRLMHALKHTALLGVTHNIPFLLDLLAHPAYAAGETHTGFIGQQYPDGWREPHGDVPLALVTAALVMLTHAPQLETNAGYWRNSPNRPLRYRFALEGDSTPREVFVTPQRGGAYSVTLDSDAQALTVTLDSLDVHDAVLTLDGLRQRVMFAHAHDRWYVQTPRGVVAFESLPLLPLPQSAADAGGSLRAPMPGSVIAVLVEVGQAVKKGDALLKLEAMKMEHTITTAADGVVEEIFYRVGDTVQADAQLVRITHH